MLKMRLLAGFAALFGAAAANAADFTNSGAIDAAVARFTGAAIGEPGGARLPVDRRMKLAHCDGQLALEWHGKGKDTVLVRCPMQNGWRLFVPTTATAAPDDLAEAALPLVSRGENVTIAVYGRGFTLTRQGEALDGGSEGEWVRVRVGGKRGDAMRARVLRSGVVGMGLQ